MSSALADPGPEGEVGLVDELGDDPPEDQARRVPDPLDVLSERGEVGLGGIGARGARRLGAGQLDQPRRFEVGEGHEADRILAGGE